MNILITKLLGLCLIASIASVSNAQYPHDKINLYRHFGLAELEAGGGNSCWGYVSPSGREYAIMGCNNKVAFVEITDPTNCNYFASIPHGAGLWADVKVYKNALYLATETDGVGVQVIDLSNIDNHQVTLVKTIASPGRSHTLNVDPDSGFLYCVGTRQSTGTTVCFDLTTPLNPVKVGSNSLTTNYIHECQVVTYKSGPYANKQILFGGSEGRGLDIYDVTDKNNTRLIKRITYPFVGYCHQGWLSSDRKYFYVNDEFDEGQQGFNVRTLVFDVSVLETADLVSTYSNNRPTIDHNIYTKNGFIFHSNYSSGFWIFDGNADPKNPTYRGYFDTFPSDDRRDYVGTWSNYVQFPSGTCIISDINDGLFIVDVSEATKTPAKTTIALVDKGRTLSGGVGDLGASDGKSMDIARGFGANASQPTWDITFESVSPWVDISRIQFNLRHRVDQAGLIQTIELYDWNASQWTATTVNEAPRADTTFEVKGSNPDRFVEPTTKRIKARLRIQGPGSSQSKTLIDEASWVINP